MLKITKFIVQDLFRNWIILLYMIFLMAASFGFFMLEGQADKALLGLLNLSLLVVPMMTIIFSTMYYYNMYEFIVLMLAQPLKRKTILSSIFLGLCIAFGLALIVGLGIPMLVMNYSIASLMLLGVDLLLTFIFIAIALVAGIWTRDKAKGMGVSLLFWVYFVLIFDGLILLLMYNFSDYPIEKIILYITLLNPIDIGRILVLMQTQAAALMGYSGAVFNQFFTQGWGIALAFLALLFWTALPVFISFRLFHKKDL
ncbi:ABC transporter permease subunit [Marivirga sp. S37H4]|uniref:ABC transporter permease subunit n=1 Tax=Marivirga aurantiaca TaxID=2802615 RepID=A0A934WXH8_9BACT|nr:ABC transporter permease subunit [Marivirga aurantiaca]MBK6264953.1 ABC transporter permease subunit [Marivirga aurantiaca]